MRKQLLQWGCIGFAGLLALPGVTFAQQQAYTNSPVNMRAGPAGDYPIVTQLPGGVPVTVMGCISGYTWCDVVVPNLRGWVYAGRLSYPYQGGNVPILTYGTTIGLPIVTFSIGSYWGSYYRGRPWYNQQSRWANRPPPGPGPGRPPGYGGRPPPGPQPGHGGGASSRTTAGPRCGRASSGTTAGPRCGWPSSWATARSRCGWTSSAAPGQGAGGRPPGSQAAVGALRDHHPVMAAAEEMVVAVTAVVDKAVATAAAAAAKQQPAAARLTAIFRRSRAAARICAAATRKRRPKHHGFRVACARATRFENSPSRPSARFRGRLEHR